MKTVYLQTSNQQGMVKVMNVSDAIRLKRAVRAFSPETLPDEIILTILNAGRRAQSSKNTQPWHFIAITERSTLQDLSQCGDWAGHLAGAALGVAIVHPDPTERFQILFDIGQAAAYMQLAAWELGAGSCLASIYEPDKARALLGFPDSYHIRFALSFGFPLETEKINQPPKKGGRKGLEEIVHWNHW
jgi:nitroreductase